MPEQQRIIFVNGLNGQDQRGQQIEIIARRLACDFVRVFHWEGLLEAAQGHGCIVSDVLIGSQSLVDVLDELVELKPTFKVLLWSDQLDVTTAVRALRGGVHHVLPLSCGSTALMLSIHEALLAAVELDRQFRKESGLLSVIQGLRPGELEVLRLMLSGMLNKEIAEQLGVSPRTVELRRQRILNASKASNAVHLAYMVSQSPRVWKLIEQSGMSADPGQPAMFE